jgi:hypothetical protein
VAIVASAPQKMTRAVALMMSAPEEPELSPREVAVAFTDAEKTLSPRPASIVS